jgi:hypothetical protein
MSASTVTLTINALLVNRVRLVDDTQPVAR